LEARKSDIVLTQKSSRSQSISIKTMKETAFSLDRYLLEKEEKLLHKCQLLRRKSVRIMREKEEKNLFKHHLSHIGALWSKRPCGLNQLEFAFSTECLQKP